MQQMQTNAEGAQRPVSNALTMRIFPSWQPTLHKLDKTWRNNEKSPVWVTQGEMSFCCVNQASGSAIGFSAAWLRSPTEL